MAFLSSLTSLIFSESCILCLKQDWGHEYGETSIREFENIGICGTCQRNLGMKATRSMRGDLKIFSGLSFSSTTSHIILAAKESNQIRARKLLAISLSHALYDAAILNGNRSITLIPIPSRRAANRSRGFAHSELLVKELIKLNIGLDIKVLNCLHHAKKISDQSTLNLTERKLNMSDAFEVRSRYFTAIRQLKNSNARLFIVDDLVTTGATVLAANTALSRLGLSVHGVIASCASMGFTH